MWSHIRKLIWATGFIVMFALMTKDLIPLVLEYKYNNYDSGIRISTEGTVIPNVTICLPYYSSLYATLLTKMRDFPLKFFNRSEPLSEYCPKCDLMRNHTWDLSNFAQENENMTVFEYVIEGMLKGERPQYPNRPTCDSVTVSENFPAYNISTFKSMQIPFDYVWYYLGDRAKTDLAMLLADGQTTSDDEDSADEQSDAFEKWFPNDVMDKLSEYLITLIPDMISGGCTYKGADWNYTVSMNEIAQLSSLTVLGDQYCFPIPRTLENNTNQVECSFNDQLYPWHVYQGSRFEIYGSPVALYSSISGNAQQKKNLLYQTDPQSLRLDALSENIEFTYDIDSRMIARKSGKTCSDEEYPEICIIKKQVATGVRDCGCIPFRYRHMISDLEIVSTNHTTTSLPYCNDKLYRNCQGILARSLNRAQDECQLQCEYTFARWRQAKVVEMDNGDRFRASIRVSKKPFIEFKITEKFTMEQFISQIGGIVNFYLGFSGLTAFALLVMTFDFGKRVYEQRQMARRQPSNLSDVTGVLKMVTIFRAVGMTANKGTSEAGATGQGGRTNAAGIDQLKMEIEELRKENFRILEMLKAKGAPDLSSGNGHL